MNWDKKWSLGRNQIHDAFLKTTLDIVDKKKKQEEEEKWKQSKRAIKLKEKEERLKKQMQFFINPNINFEENDKKV